MTSATGNRLTVDVVLVGPREGETCALAGFDFNEGVAKVPANAATAIHILAKYHSAYPRDSRDFEKAQAEWERRQQRPSGESAPAAKVPAADTDEALVKRLEAERAEVEDELARTRAELRAAREAQRAAEAKAQETKAQATPQTPPPEEPPKGGKASRAKAQAE